MSDPKYVLFSCIDTMGLLTWSASAKGLRRDTVWGPTEWVPQFQKLKDGTVKDLSHWRSSWPGVVFVRFGRHETFRRLCPSLYNAQAMTIQYLAAYRTAPMSDLRIWEQTIKDFNNGVRREKHDVVKGSRVKVTGPLFEGMEGEVCCSGKHRIVRVLIGAKYVNLPKSLLIHV